MTVKRYLDVDPLFRTPIVESTPSKPAVLSLVENAVKARGGFIFNPGGEFNAVENFNQGLEQHGIKHSFYVVPIKLKPKPARREYLGNNSLDLPKGASLSSINSRSNGGASELCFTNGLRIEGSMSETEGRT